MNKEKTYPVTYIVFKNRILEYFLEKDWEYNTKFTKEQKQEFLDNHNFDFKESYREECDNYDKGLLNVFTTPEDAHKYILGLLFDCESYFNSKEVDESQKSEIDESKYPMTYEEFEKLVGKIFVRDAPKQFTDVTVEEAKQGWKQYLKENGDVRFTYEERCEMYDNFSPKHDKNSVFDEEALSAGPVYYMIQWVFF